MGSLGLNRPPYQSGYDTSILAGSDADWLMVGASVDWGLVAPAAADVTLPGGQLIKAGWKYLRYGQVMARITAGAGHVRGFGPFDPAATDGRAVLARGDCGIIERTVVLAGTFGLGLYDDQHIGLVTKGHVWLGKLIQSGTAAPSLAAGPTLAELLAALPDLVPVTK